MVVGEGLVDVVHQDGEHFRRLVEVVQSVEDEFFISFRRLDGSVLRISKRFIVRIEPSIPRRR